MTDKGGPDHDWHIPQISKEKGGARGPNSTPGSLSKVDEYGVLIWGADRLAERQAGWRRQEAHERREAKRLNRNETHRTKLEEETLEREGGEKKERVEADQPFYPVDNDRPRLLSFARFDNELLGEIQGFNVPVLRNAVWQPNGDGELCGGFGCVERATWNDQDIAVKFLKGTRTESGLVRSKRVSECIINRLSTSLID